MGDIVVRGSMGLDEIQRWGKVFIASGIFKGEGDPNARMAQAIIKIQYGQELGLPPFAAMDGIDIIDGRPAPNAGLTAALVKRSGKYDFRITESNNRGCHLEWTEHGSVVGVSSFVEDDARAAGLLGKRNWQSYPVDMYFSRALTRGARRFCADLFLGSVYTPEELGRDDVPGAAVEPLPPQPSILDAPKPEAPPTGDQKIWYGEDDTDEPPLEDRLSRAAADLPVRTDETMSEDVIEVRSTATGEVLARITDVGPTTFESEGIQIDEAIAARVGQPDAGSPAAVGEAEGRLAAQAAGGRDFFGEKLVQLCAAPMPDDSDWCESVLVKICANLEAAKTAEEAMRMRAFVIHLPEPYKQQAKDTVEATIAELSGSGDADATALGKLLAEVEECGDRDDVTALMGAAQKLGLPPETWRAFYAAAQGKMVTFKPEPLAKRKAPKRG